MSKWREGFFEGIATAFLLAGIVSFFAHVFDLLWILFFSMSILFYGFSCWNKMRQRTKIFIISIAIIIVVVVGLGVPILIKCALKGLPSINISQLENEIFNLINLERAKNDLSPVVWNEQIAVVAESYSKNMAENNFFFHQSPQGKSPDDRLHDGGIVFSICGEVLFEQSIIVNKTTDWIFLMPVESVTYKNQSVLAQNAVRGWMLSPTHRIIILRPYFDEAGVGVWFDETIYYFTVNFISID